VPTAALTNIAMAVRKEPRIAERVAEVVLMGGAVAGGNRTAAAESNIVTDPEAAHIVFGERWPVTMVGLELTVQAVATPDVVDRIAGLGTTPARYVLEVLEFFGGTYLAEQGLPHPSVHDLCAVARVIDPTVITTRRAPITVELAGVHTRGMTIAALRGPAPPDCHTQVAVDLDHARFWDLVLDALERIGSRERALPREDFHGDVVEVLPGFGIPHGQRSGVAENARVHIRDDHGRSRLQLGAREALVVARGDDRAVDLRVFPILGHASKRCGCGV